MEGERIKFIILLLCLWKNQVHFSSLGGKKVQILQAQPVCVWSRPLLGMNEACEWRRLRARACAFGTTVDVKSKWRGQGGGAGVGGRREQVIFQMRSNMWDDAF